MNAMQRPPLQPWYGRRLIVPVVSASGGAGNSTVSAALATALTVCVGDVAVLDTSPRGGSPWPNWLVQPPGGGTQLLAWHRQRIGLNQPLPRDVVLQAASRFSGVGRVVAFTDTAPWQSRPTAVETGPAWWAGVMDVYRGVVVDCPATLLTDLFRMSAGDNGTVAHDWLALGADVVPVLVTGWSGDAVTAASACLSLLESTGVPTSRVVVAAVNQSEAPPPPGVLSVLTALAGRGIPVVNLPYEPAFRAEGARAISRAQEGYQIAVTDLVNAVLARTSTPPGAGAGAPMPGPMPGPGPMGMPAPPTAAFPQQGPPPGWPQPPAMPPGTPAPTPGWGQPSGPPLQGWAQPGGFGAAPTGGFPSPPAPPPSTAGVGYPVPAFGQPPPLGAPAFPPAPPPAAGAAPALAPSFAPPPAPAASAPPTGVPPAPAAMPTADPGSAGLSTPPVPEGEARTTLIPGSPGPWRGASAPASAEKAPTPADDEEEPQDAIPEDAEHDPDAAATKVLGRMRRGSAESA